MNKGKVAAILIGVLVLGSIAATAVFVRSLDGIFENDVTDHMADWPAFYESDMSKVIGLPSDAWPLKAKETYGFGTHYYEVEFLLPPSRTPEEWLQMIADGAGVTEYRKSPHLYDAGFASEGRPPKMDHFELSYDPATQHYRAWWGWS